MTMNDKNVDESAELLFHLVVDAGGSLLETSLHYHISALFPPKK